MLPELIKTVMLQKKEASQETFVDDANCVLEALLSSLTIEQIQQAIKAHGLKGPSYLSTARSLQREALKRRPLRNAGTKKRGKNLSESES